MELNKIYCMDALEFLRNLPDKSVDLILTDPPYGIGEAAGKNKSRSNLAVSKDYGTKDWDNAIPTEEVFKEIFRVSKNQIIFGGNYFVEYLPNSSCWIVWDKDNGENDFADCELAFTSFPTAVRRFKWRWAGMLQERMSWKEKRYHPTQKPLPLFRWILEKYAKEGQIVCDPFIGSGTTAVACKQLGIKYIGCDIDSEYVSIAEERLKQGTLLEAFNETYV